MKNTFIFFALTSAVLVGDRRWGWGWGCGFLVALVYLNLPLLAGYLVYFFLNENRQAAWEMSIGSLVG